MSSKNFAIARWAFGMSMVFICIALVMANH